MKSKDSIQARRPAMEAVYVISGVAVALVTGLLAGRIASLVWGSAATILYRDVALLVIVVAAFALTKRKISRCSDTALWGAAATLGVMSLVALILGVAKWWGGEGGGAYWATASATWVVGAAAAHVATSRGAKLFDEHTKQSATHILVACVACVGVVSAAYATISADDARLREDARVLAALSEIEVIVAQSYERDNTLPAQLPSDAVPHALIVGTDAYQRIDDHSFRLCATFQEALNATTAKRVTLALASGSAEYIDFISARLAARWAHDAGYTCFTRTLGEQY